MPDQAMLRIQTLPTDMTFVKQPAAANVFYSRTKQVEFEVAQRPTTTAARNINTRDPDVYHYRRSRNARWDNAYAHPFIYGNVC